MKLRNNITIALIVLATLIIPTLQSCQKYPDGPQLSLRSRAARLSNNWKVENYKVNGDDYTSLVSGYSESFSKSGAYSYSWGILDGSGTWSFQNKDEEVKLSGNDTQSSRTLYIQKLEEKALWYYYLDGDDKHELHLISN